MARPSNPSVDPALDAAALLRRVGFFGLFVVVPVVAQVARRAAVILAPIAVVLLILASAVDGRQSPLRPTLARLAKGPAFWAGVLILAWCALSLVWTPFLSTATERLLNLLATVGLTIAGYLALPERMRSANLYLIPLGVAAAAIVATMLGLFSSALSRTGDENTLDRGLTLLALLIWPAVAWLRSRHRDKEALAIGLVVAAAVAIAGSTTQIVPLAIGAVAFALTSARPALGVTLTAGLTAALLVLAPLLPFVARPLGTAIAGPVAPAVLSLKAWQRVVTTEPVRLITGHGFETALRGRAAGNLPPNAPTTMLFELWYELGVVGAFAAAYLLYASIRRAGRDAPLLVPGAMAAFATAFAIGCIGVGLTVMWWITSLAVAALVFVSIERGQFRSRRPKIGLLRRGRDEA